MSSVPDKNGEALKGAHDALQEFDDTVDMSDEASVGAWWNAWGAPALDALDKVRCTPVHGSCNRPAGHAGLHDAAAPSARGTPAAHWQKIESMPEDVTHMVWPGETIYCYHPTHGSFKLETPPSLEAGASTDGKDQS